MSSEPPKMWVSVDLVVLTNRSRLPCVLLVQRRFEPYKGEWALPGGFVELNEDLPDAASRELYEETNLYVPSADLKELGTYGKPNRAPRRVITVAFGGMFPSIDDPIAADDAQDARFVPLRSLPDLAYDHAEILTNSVTRIGSRTAISELTVQQ